VGGIPTLNLDVRPGGSSLQRPLSPRSNGFPGGLGPNGYAPNGYLPGGVAPNGYDRQLPGWNGAADDSQFRAPYGQEAPYGRSRGQYPLDAESPQVFDQSVSFQ
jgi:hypothetical protein